MISSGNQIFLQLFLDVMDMWTTFLFLMTTLMAVIYCYLTIKQVLTDIVRVLLS